MRPESSRFGLKFFSAVSDSEYKGRTADLERLQVHRPAKVGQRGEGSSRPPVELPVELLLQIFELVEFLLELGTLLNLCP